MRLALQLAQRGAGQVNPNPRVGAVIVKEGRVSGQGWHEKFGGLHAVSNALGQGKQGGGILTSINQYGIFRAG